jgi:hypothetical protein
VTVPGVAVSDSPPGARRPVEIAFCAGPSGYGPAAKAVAIAERLRTRDITFVGTGVALEMAARSAAFSATIEARPGTRAASAALRAARRVVCVMDPYMARYALELGRPLSVADSLFWLWHRVPRSFLRARPYWVQRFADVERRRAAFSPRPVPVGPIVAERPKVTGARRGLVVNLGGSAPHDRPYGLPYARFVVDAFLRSELHERFDGDVLLMAGEACVRELLGASSNGRLRVTSLRHGEARVAIASAELLLSCPGLTTTLEGFRWGTPVLFLPPQNYSQWVILERLRRERVAEASFHWGDVCPGHGVQARMPGRLAVRRVRRLVRAAACDPKVSELLRARLDAAASVEPAALARRQGRFVEGLGGDGAATIAGSLLDEG